MKEEKNTIEKNIDFNATLSFILIILNFILIMTFISYSESSLKEIGGLSFIIIFTVLYFFFFVSYKGKERKIINKIFYVLLFLSFISYLIIQYLVALGHAYSNH